MNTLMICIFILLASAFAATGIYTAVNAAIVKQRVLTADDSIEDLKNGASDGVYDFSNGYGEQRVPAPVERDCVTLNGKRYCAE